MLQRVKEVQESDLRMSGSLAHNIQRVLAVTQADIDAAAAQGRAWVVKPVVKVSDPLDNLRGGTQLVIKQNSILPGQNVMRVMYVGGQAVVVGPDVPPLSLPDATANDLVSLKAFGGIEQNGTPTPTAPIDIVCNNGVLKARHQSGLPTGYTLLDYIGSTRTQYLDLGVKGNGTTRAEVKFKYDTATSASGSGRVFGSRNAAAVDAFAIGSASGTALTSSKIAFFFGNQSYLVTDKSLVLDEWLDVIFDKTTHIINGTDYGDPYNDETFETPQNLKLFGFDNNGTMGYGQVDVARCKLWDNGVLIRDLVPCKNASNVVGMYDLANDQFYTNDGTGDFVAGSTVSDPVEIYTDGTVETIKLLYNHWDMTKASYTTPGFNVSSASVAQDGTFSITNSSGSSASRIQLTLSASVLGLINGQKYTLKVFILDGNAFKGSCLIYHGSSSRIYSCDGTQTTLVDSWTQSADNDVKVGMLYFNDYAVGTTVRLRVMVVAGETEPDTYEPYIDNTATAEMLLKVGDYQDVQSIIDGVVTRNVGVKVLDGTEVWLKGTSFFTQSTDFVPALQQTHTCLCTHYQGIATNTATTGDSNKIKVGYNVGAETLLWGRIYIYADRSLYATAQDFKNYLAAQYAAGTPVIVIYPLATATTESVTGQTLQVQAGDNTLEITQASLSGLELEAEYTKAE